MTMTMLVHMLQVLFVGIAAAWMPASFQQSCARQLSSRWSIITPIHVDRFTSVATNHTDTLLRLPPETMPSNNAQQTTKKKQSRRSWNKSFTLLQEYKTNHGDCNVPRRYKNDTALARWVTLQRRRHEQLSVKHRQALDALCFDWNLPTSPERRNRKLQTYRNKNGNSNVFANKTIHPTPDELVAVQSSNKTYSSQDQHAALNATRQSWNATETKSIDMPTQVYIDPVLSRWKEDCSLAWWLALQLILHPEVKLPSDLAGKLILLGFAWTVAEAAARVNTADMVPHESRWFVGYSKLLSFYLDHGHCEIPLAYDKAPWLAAWASEQRRLHHVNGLKPTRKHLLDRLRFSWRAS